jgi:hypothetical protein
VLFHRYVCVFCLESERCPKIVDGPLFALSLGKLRRYEVANLLFELMALYFTWHYTEHVNGTPSIALWAGVIAMGLVCIFWACKQ